MNEGLIKTLLVGAAIAAHRIVKFDAAAHTVIQADDPADFLMGVSDLAADGVTDTRVDVILGGIAKVEYGDDVVAGDPLTADANGKAVPSAPAAEATDRIIGYAMVAGAAGDIGRVLLKQGSNSNATDGA